MPGKTNRIAILLLIALPALAGDDPFQRFLSGARSGRAEKREAAFETLLGDPGVVPEARWPRVEKVLLSALEKDSRPHLRGLAARCLALHPSTESEVRIIRKLAEERDWRAQRPMLDALDGFTSEAAVGLARKKVFREPREDVRALWVEALGRSGSAGAYEVLLQFAAASHPWIVAQAAALALGRHRTKESVDRLIDLLWSEDDGVRAAARESLVKLTGKRSLPAVAGDWRKWWNENRDDFGFPDGKPRPGVPPATLPPESVSVPTYYDIPIKGRRVVFCLDVSASMWGPKFTAAKRELSRAVRSLPSNYTFGMFFFNEHPIIWRDDLTPAFPFQKLECVTDFEALTTKKYTNIYDTLERALGFAGLGRWAKEDAPGVDDVFILTDGEPNRGRYRDLKGILHGLSEVDPKRTVRIHAISVGDDPRALMAAIAKEHGGRHAHVDAKR